MKPLWSDYGNKAVMCLGLSALVLDFAANRVK